MPSLLHMIVSKYTLVKQIVRCKKTKSKKYKQNFSICMSINRALKMTEKGLFLLFAVTALSIQKARIETFFLTLVTLIVTLYRLIFNVCSYFKIILNNVLNNISLIRLRNLWYLKNISKMILNIKNGAMNRSKIYMNTSTITSWAQWSPIIHIVINFRWTGKNEINMT